MAPRSPPAAAAAAPQPLVGPSPRMPLAPPPPPPPPTPSHLPARNRQVISKLAFLSETNILSNMATLVTWMLAAIVWVVTLGGFPAVPTHGFASAGAPTTNAPCPPHAQCPMPQCPNGPMPQWPNAPMPQCPNAPMPRCPNAPTPQCPMPQCPNVRMRRPMPNPRCPNPDQVSFPRSRRLSSLPSTRPSSRRPSGSTWRRKPCSTAEPPCHSRRSPRKTGMATPLVRRRPKPRRTRRRWPQ